jgi:pimeloyl-ACP methyl ester carboxylesterase
MATYLERHPSRAPSPDGRDADDPTDAPFVLVHGLGGDRHTWRPVIDGLTAERDVLVVELPGFGASTPLPEELEPSPVALAAAVLRRLDEAGVGRFHVVGHSLGGWVALELADLAPSRVVSVTALTPAGFWPQPLSERQGRAITIGRRLSPLLPLLFAFPFLRGGVLAGALGGPGRFGYRDALRIVRGYVGATDYERVNAAMRRRVFDVTLRLTPLAARIPVFVVWADEDRMVSPPAVRPPEGVFQHVLLGAGHLPTYDQPDRTTFVLLAAADKGSTLAQAA